jgi:hypothetical protein
MGPRALTSAQRSNGVRTNVVGPRSFRNTPRDGVSSGTSGPITLNKLDL